MMTQLPFTIRQVTIADAQAIAELHVRAWQWAYQGLLPDAYLAGLSLTLDRRIEFLQDQIAHMPPDTRGWLIEQAGRLAGYAVTCLSRDPDASPTTAEVMALYLAPEAVGQGIGRALFAYAVEDLRLRGYQEAILWVLTNNQRARTFYEAAGWKADGASKTEERPGALLDEVRYHLDLRL
jgi:GNAT superfamily N-acetyltransferase